MGEAGEGRSYPLSLRGVGYETWKPWVGIVLFVASMFLLAPAILLVLLAGLLAATDGTLDEDRLASVASLDPVTWQGMLYLNLVLAALIPVTWAIVRLIHQQRPRTLASVRPGFRWRFFWACFGLSLIALAAQVVVAEFLPGDPNGLHDGVNTWTSTLTAFAVVIALTTPLQAIGEEYAFRGYLLQAFGSLSRRPWVGILISALLFACAHGFQNPPLFLDRFTFGLMAGYIVYRTGGLEAGIAMHIWNNIVAFGFALVIGDIDETLNVTSVPWSNIVLTVTQNGVYLLLVLWLAKRMELRTRIDEVAVLPPPPPGSTPVLLPTTPPV